jgi:hypothetical protein
MEAKNNSSFSQSGFLESKTFGHTIGLSSS